MESDTAHAHTGVAVELVCQNSCIVSWHLGRFVFCLASVIALHSFRGEQKAVDGRTIE